MQLVLCTVFLFSLVAVAFCHGNFCPRTFDSCHPKDVLKCFLNPCKIAKCNITATCWSDYCKGCNYIFVDDNHDIVPWCTNVPDVREYLCSRLGHPLPMPCPKPWWCSRNPCKGAKCHIKDAVCLPYYCDGHCDRYIFVFGRANSLIPFDECSFY